MVTMSLRAQQSSVLSSGKWYKIAVSKQGVYKIDRAFLNSMGIDVDNINPKNIQLYGNGGKVLPQANSADRPIDLIQHAIAIIGEDDHSFDSNDYLLFYATGIDSAYFDTELGALIYNNHPYETKAYYYLTVGDSEGRRMLTEADQGNSFSKIDSYDYFDILEEEKTNILISGREWYGDRFDITTDYEYPFDVTNLKPDGNIQITSSLMAQSYDVSSFDIALNGTAIGSQEIESVTSYQYGLKGRENTATFTNPTAEFANNNDTWRVQITYNQNDSDRSIGYTDYIIFQASRSLIFDDEQINFRSLRSLDNPFGSYEISRADENLRIWDVTTAFSPKAQEYGLADGLATFGVSTMTLKEYSAFNANTAFTPAFVNEVDSQNLRGENAPELLIVVHPDFKSEAQRLANFRSQHDGYEVLVVTTEEVFNEFSSGSQDPTAIRDMAKFYYDQGSLKHLLLFGKCSYDFKEIKSINNNFVPTYPSRDALHPLKTYSSDDYYGFLENAEGAWEESSHGDHSLDIGVGRLPITTLQEAKDVVDKLINYDSDTNAFGNWRNNVVFVADDGELTGNLHHKQADQLTVFTDTTYAPFNTKKIFLDSYEQISKPAGVRAPLANEAINTAIDNGALIINYTGHGGESGWAQEVILDHSMINSWTNTNRLPLFVTATCEFGRHDNPVNVSGAERIVLNPDGGGIAIVTTGRPVNSGSNFLLNKAFYENVFKKINGRYPTLGEVFMGTKNESLNGSSNRNFSLLGDPSMTLSYPNEQVIVDEIISSTGSIDTLSALSKITIHGHIQNNPSFQGIAQVTVYDKQSALQTLGGENPIYHYKEWENLIFQGNSTIVDGNFTAEFIVPKNINYELGYGEISIYALDSDQQIDGNGSHNKIVIGGSADVISTDKIAPAISLYINDTIVQNKTIGSNILLLAKLHDESGINISNYGVGGGIQAILDDSISFEIGAYYHTLNDTYQAGWVLFPIDDLSTGQHRIEVKFSDTFGNTSMESIQFYVNASELIITKLFNYPNPVDDHTTFGFAHNFAGDHLEIDLTVYKPNGGILFSRKTDIANILDTVEFAVWEIDGKELAPGIYIYGISVRSLTKGVKNSRFQKLIIPN
jgi:hypothetical protein